MKSLSVKLGVILIGLLILGYAEVWGADWKYLGAASNGTFWWYDTQGVTYQLNKVIQVWIKKVKANEIMDKVKSGTKLSVPEVEQMTSKKNYERYLLEIDCLQNTVSLLQKLNYDPGEVLKGGESKPSQKETIPKDSVGEKLYQAVCK